MLREWLLEHVIGILGPFAGGICGAAHCRVDLVSGGTLVHLIGAGNEGCFYED
jgi:hypothetical protein